MPLSNFHDLAASDATTALIINGITSVGQFQRDLQNELTADGIAAPRPKAATAATRPHRPPTLEQVRSTYADQRTSIAALARTYGVSRATIRTALADLLPDPSIPTPRSPLTCGSVLGVASRQ